MGAFLEAGITAMRCLTCNAEMHLAEAIDDITMPVSGYENQTWRCSSCDDVERRLIFRRGDSGPERANHTDAREECGQPQKERLAASAWGQILAKLSNSASAWGQLLTKSTNSASAWGHVLAGLSNRKQLSSLAGKLAAGVYRLERYLTDATQRLRGSWMVNKNLSYQLPSQASSAAVVQNQPADVRSLNLLVEKLQADEVPAPAIAPSDTRSDHPVVSDVIINEGAIADAARGAVAHKQISDAPVVAKTLADYQNFDELWESLGPSRPPGVPA